jgi:hypothetical protein
VSFGAMAPVPAFKTATTIISSAPSGPVGIDVSRPNKNRP